MLNNAQSSPESFSSRNRENNPNQAIAWSTSDRAPYEDARRNPGDHLVNNAVLPPIAEVFSNQQQVNLDATQQLLKDKGRLFDALDVADDGGRHDGKISQNDLQIFLGDADSKRHFSRHQLDAVQYLLDNWDNDAVKGLKTENSLFMNGYITRDTLAQGLGFDSQESLQASISGRGNRRHEALAPNPQVQNDAATNTMTARLLLKNNGDLFDALDVAAHGGRQDGQFSQNDLSNFLANPVNAKHFSPDQMVAAKYLLDNWDNDAIKGLKTENSLFMNGYITRDSLAKGLGFDSRESMTKSLADPMAGKFYPTLELTPSCDAKQVEFHKGDTIFAVARRSLVERSHSTGEPVDRDSIFRECNRIMVKNGFPDAHLEGKTHITQHDLPRAWNSIRDHQILTLYTPENLQS